MHTGADQVTIWGSGTPRREFLHVDDMAAACVHVMELAPVVYQAHTRPMLSHINVGTGTDVTIRELAETIARVTGFPGRLAFDPGKPDGTPRKLLDVSRLKALGWEASSGWRRGCGMLTAGTSGTPHPHLKQKNSRSVRQPGLIQYLPPTPGTGIGKIR
jgi:GDP-L-fucose synthase